MRKPAAVILALALAVLVGAGIAYASIPGPDGTINGCRKNTDGSLRVIDSTATCPNGYTALNWPSVSGRVANANAADQAESLRLVEMVVGENYRDGQRVMQAFAVCPVGYKVTGGGFEGVSPTASVVGSAPSRGATGQTTYQGWLVDISEPNGDPGVFRAWALCVHATYWWSDGSPFGVPAAEPPYPGNPGGS